MTNQARYLRDRLLGPPMIRRGYELVDRHEIDLLEELDELVADGVVAIDIKWGPHAAKASREAKAAAVLEYLRRQRVITVIPRETRRIFQFA